jgi:SAM-dependent methyltransferase
MNRLVLPIRPWPAWTCPVHGEELQELEDELRCAQGHAYTVRDGIPRFVDGSTYADHFGLQWKTFKRTQLDSYTGSGITRDRLKRAIGDTLWHSLAGRDVLECGCGAGRFTEILIDRGARVTSVDLSSAIEANAENFPPGDSHRIAQADIMQLPFAQQTFDVVLCLGVVQHTPSPEKTIEELYRFVKPGGTLVIDHYTYDLRRYTSTLPLYRAWMKRLPLDSAMNVTERLVDVFLPWHKRFAHVPVVRSVLGRLSPVQAYYAEHPELDDRIQREWALLDTHDGLTDWYKHLRSRSQIRRTFERLGLVEIWCEYGGNGVEARGVRPG